MTESTTAPAEPRPFDVCGELPTGMTLLQASAGTGKTFTIAALTTRYVAEGILPIDRLLVITFTRMATGELRERVRERLVRAFEGLVDVLGGAGPAAHPDDEVVTLLAQGTTEEIEARRDRLGKAIADFDAATIETTHGFCLQVLYGLGTAGDVDREVTLVEDVSDLMEEVVDDLYLRKFASRPNPLKFTREAAMEIAKFVLGHPDADIVPPLSDAQDEPSIRRRFAKAVRDEMKERKQTLKILTYDDVLLRLRDTLADPVRGPVACGRLRERYDVVLVDEFQDTDPVQWEIMHRAFGLGGATLVLIGDPKQAIYAFRGADVHAYLIANKVVQSEWTLDVNWRSDQGLLEAYDALFADAQLGYEDITYRQDPSCRRPPESAPRGCARVDALALPHGPRRGRTCPADPVEAAAQGGRRPQRHRPGPGGRRRAACSRPGPSSLRPAATGPRPSAPARPRRHRRAGAGQLARDAGARCLVGGRRAGGHRWGRVGLRHRAGPGVAAAARGARASDGAGPGLAGGADLLRGLERRRGGWGRRGRHGRTSTGRCTSGRRCCVTRGWPRCSRPCAAPAASPVACSSVRWASGS